MSSLTSLEPCPRLTESSLALLQTLSSFFPLPSDTMTSLIAWLDAVCARDDVTRQPSDVFVKNLLNFVCDVTMQRGNLASRLTDIARDIHVTLGDIDPEVTVDRADMTFALLATEGSVRVIFPLLLMRLDGELSDVDAILSERRNAVTSGKTNAADGQGSDAQEKALYGKVGHCINALHELTQSAIAQSSTCEKVVKTLTRVYTILSSMARQV